MSHFKLSKNEIDLFVRSMKSYRKKLDDDHPNDYPYVHPVSIIAIDHRQCNILKSAKCGS